MPTETKAKNETVVNVTPSLLTAVTAYISAVGTMVDKFATLAKTLRSESDRQGFDRDGANKLAQAAWIKAHGLPETEQLPMKYRPDVSKVLALAYPAKPAAQRELEVAENHNSKAKSNSERIGINSLLEISRGNMTAKQAIAGKQKKAKSGLDSVSTPQERFSRSVDALLAAHKVGARNRTTADEATKIFAERLAAFVK